LDGLKWTVRHAFEGSPFYRQRLTEAGVAPDQIRSLDDLKRLPFVAAQDLQANYPWPQSSQTEQDSRLFGLFAKAPVFDPSSPREAQGMVAEAFDLSEKYEIPVILRPTTRVCHGRQNVACRPPLKESYLTVLPSSFLSHWLEFAEAYGSSPIQSLCFCAR
jgi:hypothetical protein